MKSATDEGRQDKRKLPSVTELKGDARPQVDRRALERLLAGWDSGVTLCSRTRLSDGVVDAVHDLVCSCAGRDLALDVRVVPTMEAGAVLYIGDAGRVVLDQRATWLTRVERELKERAEGETREGQDGYGNLREALSASALSVSVEGLQDTGTVMRLGDGVASVAGLRQAGSQELIEFEGGCRGIAFSLRERDVGVVLLDPEFRVREGGDARRTGHPIRVPVGDAMLGRVIDPLGRPLDDKGPVVPAAWLPAERLAPGVVDRQPVNVPLHTGQKVIDALVPIGRGQRELIIGDRKIGKTTIALDTILAQRGAGVPCIYCSIGQKASSVREVVAALEEHGSLEYTAVVAALPGDSPALRYLAPFSACALGEYFLDRGEDALVVYDDLSKHAVTYREISALLDRPVGREAYPGDVFYLHSRLLERACRLSDERGGGSLTALPIVETLAGDISAFIPTNVISICDGQIVLEAAAFNEGRRPAINAGLSVSRVGGSAQAHSMKQVAGRLRIDLAQFEEMARFVKFGAEVDDATRRQLSVGERCLALLEQPAHTPMRLEYEMLVLHAAVSGLFENVDVGDLAAVERDLVEWASVHHPELIAKLAETDGLDDELEESLNAEVRQFLASRVSMEPVS